MPTFHQLLKNVAIDYATAITGSTGNSNYPVIDMRGYEAIAFAAFPNGTPSTAGSSIKIQQGSSSGMSTGDAADLTGTSVSLSSSITDGYVATDIYRPGDRYVRLVHVKTSTADIFNNVVVLQYRPGYAPITHGSTAKQHGVEYHVSPAEGTA